MSKIEVNQISSQCGSTLTIGQSGDTVTLASGATQTGFGRTGTVDWDTTAKTASFTAVSGTGYFVNTTSAAVTMTLPATPSAGDIVSVKDYAYTFATNNLTVGRNGSPIGGLSGDNPIYATNGTALTFIYVDGTKGWLVTNESTDTSTAPVCAAVVATGGTISYCGDYKIHTFTSDGTFCVSCAGDGDQGLVSYLIVAGGGGGGSGCFNATQGGGGAGGFREGKGPVDSYTQSPLATTGIPVSVQAYPITVGGGGAGGPFPAQGIPGSNSIFSTITSAGGGGGGAITSPSPAPGYSGLSGGSGGGAAARSPSALGAIPVGTGNTPPVSPPQGNPGGQSVGNPGAIGSGGGGGATAAGVDGISGPGTPTSFSGAGGAGATTSISGSPTAYAGGAGGGNEIPASVGAGGVGGGGSGGWNGGNGTAGTANTGGGGGSGGQGASYVGKAGGSGIVIIRYKYQ